MDAQFLLEGLMAAISAVEERKTCEDLNNEFEEYIKKLQKQTEEDETISSVTKLKIKITLEKALKANKDAAEETRKWLEEE